MIRFLDVLLAGILWNAPDPKKASKKDQRDIKKAYHNPVMLPVMYLINLIVKNHPVPFELLFQSRIASDFCIAMKDSIPADD